MKKDNKKIQKQYDVQIVTGNISITKGRLDRYRQIYSSCKWFDGAEYFDIQDDGESLLIKKCYMEIPKTAQKFTSSKHFQFVSELPLGIFDIDEEESNEDELVVYYS